MPAKRKKPVKPPIITPKRAPGETMLAFVNRAGARLGPDGKRLPFKVRRDNYGKGLRSHPNSLAALEVHRWDTVAGGPRDPTRLRLCKHVIVGGSRAGKTCRAAAIRDHWVCYKHGGRRIVEARLKKTYADYKPLAAPLALSQFRGLAGRGLISPGLREVPGFQAVTRFAFYGVHGLNPRFSGLEGYQRRLFYEACAVLCIAYVEAWDSMSKDQDYGLWLQVTEKVRAMGLAEGLVPADLVRYKYAR